MKTLSLNISRFGLVVGIVLLAACGSGGDDSPSDPLVSGTDVPSSATTSSASAFTFVNATAGTSSDTSDPLAVGDVTLATSETDEPDPSI